VDFINYLQGGIAPQSASIDPPALGAKTTIRKIISTDSNLPVAKYKSEVTE
jgi:hypothetical protein